MTPSRNAATIDPAHPAPAMTPEPPLREMGDLGDAAPQTVEKPAVRFVAKPSVGMPDPEAVLPLLRILLKERQKRIAGNAE
jgi:hypothetical protein